MSHVYVRPGKEFVFRGLQAGLYRLQASPGGRDRQEHPEWFDGILHRVRAGTSNTVVQICIGAFIEGILLDHERKPVADGHIVASADARSAWEALAQTVSKTDGSFRLKVPVGLSVTLRASRRGQRMTAPLMTNAKAGGRRVVLELPPK